MTDYTRIPEHMRHGARLYVEQGVPPGSFLYAVLSNNLLEAFKRADDDNAAAMRDWAAFVYNDLPTLCHGSEDIVDQWIKRGGLEGVRGAA